MLILWLFLALHVAGSWTSWLSESDVNIIRLILVNLVNSTFWDEILGVQIPATFIILTLFNTLLYLLVKNVILILVDLLIVRKILL